MFPLLAVLLAGAQPSPAVPPDYVGTMLGSFNELAPNVRSHHGAVRFDFPRPNGDVWSEYDAPGQGPLITVVRNRDGEVTQLRISPRETRAVASDAGWEDISQEHTLAGETCRVQRKNVSRGLRVQRCITPDGINLLPQRYGRAMEMQTLIRRPVAESEVTPPLEFVDLHRWVPPGSLSDRGAERSHHDYIAEFPDGTVIRRSGPWRSISRTALIPSNVLLNEAARLEVIAPEPGQQTLWIERSAPDVRLNRFGFRPEPMNGRATETLFGEVCQWQARPTTPDASEYECRANDGAVLATGMYAMGGQSWRPATRFQRQPVPLASVLPDARYFTPGYYGLRATAP